jgi:hypothetical protein
VLSPDIKEISFGPSFTCSFYRLVEARQLLRRLGRVEAMEFSELRSVPVDPEFDILLLNDLLWSFGRRRYQENNNVRADLNSLDELHF